MTMLSPHISVAEFTRSDRAATAKISNDMSVEHARNAVLLCLNVIEPLRASYNKPIRVTSGYRSEALNKITPGASKSSQHSLGQAIDIQIDGVRCLDICSRIVSLALPFDQLIYEVSIKPDGSRSEWVHVSHKSEGNRRQCLTGIRNKGKTSFNAGIKGLAP